MIPIYSTTVLYDVELYILTQESLDNSSNLTFSYSEYTGTYVFVVSAKVLGSLSHSKPQFNMTSYDDPQKDHHTHTS